MIDTSVRKDIENTANTAAEQLASKASQYVNRAGEKLDQALTSAEATASNVVSSGREAGAQVQEVAGNIKTAVDRSVKDQPMATLAVAAAMGFVIGALWKS